MLPFLVNQSYKDVFRHHSNAILIALSHNIKKRFFIENFRALTTSQPRSRGHSDLLKDDMSRIVEQCKKALSLFENGNTYDHIKQFKHRHLNLVQHPAPEFTANAIFPDNSIGELSLADYRGKYVVLFFYPLDFTFVCPSELIAFNDKLKEFQAKNCEIISVSVDSHFSHLAWKKTDQANGGVGDLQFPMVSDLSKNISKNFGVLTADGTVSLRGLFLIDKQGIIRHSVVNDLPLGRNVEEAIRMVDALQHVEQVGEVCPANWKKGQKGMTPTAKGVADYLTSLAKAKI